MKCWLFHKWGKWIEGKMDIKQYFPKTDKLIDGTKDVQTRICEKCGFKEMREI